MVCDAVNDRNTDAQDDAAEWQPVFVSTPGMIATLDLHTLGTPAIATLSDGDEITLTHFGETCTYRVIRSYETKPGNFTYELEPA